MEIVYTVFIYMYLQRRGLSEGQTAFSGTSFYYESVLGHGMKSANTGSVFK